MISSIVSRLVILVFGTLYPAYASYKAVRTKNVKEYVKWMMYWIVFALFTCAETFTDVFFSFWFPFYYEIKIIIVLWLLSPATKGSSILYRRFVHPALSRREAEIDEALARATEQGYTAVLHLGTKGVNYATTVLMQTAIKSLPYVAQNTLSVPCGSQSESAVFSSANTRATLTRKASGKDRLDNADQLQIVHPSGRSRKLYNEPSSSMDIDLDVHDISTDDDEDRRIPLNDSETTEMVEDALLPKDPAERGKQKGRRKPGRPRTRKQEARACKESFKTHEEAFSDDGILD